MSSLRLKLPTFFRLVAFLAIVALLAPVVTLAAYRPALAGAIRLCGIDSKSHSGDKQHKAPSCPLCQSLRQLDSAAPPSPDASFVPFASLPVVVDLPNTSLFLAFIALPQARPRAPPILV